MMNRRCCMKRAMAGWRLTTVMTTLMLERVVASATLAVGGGHACVITQTGGVKCWGNGSKGQLGYEDTVKRGASNVTMGDALAYVDLGAGNATAVSIAAGDFHTCVVLSDYTLKCFGYSSSGQLGQGNTVNYGSVAFTMGDNLPPVNLGTDATENSRKALKVVAGSDFTCVLLEDGEVVCFGGNDHGQLGVGHSSDIGKSACDMGDSLVSVNLGRDSAGAIDISSGPCALLDTGKVKCWGNNLYGQARVPGVLDVGLNPAELGDNLPAVSLGTEGGVELEAFSVVSGARHNCALILGGQVKCWAKNTQGNLGIGGVHDRGNDEDELGDFLPFTDLGRDAHRLSGGADHTCAILDNKSVKCWGKNWSGQLGLDDYRTKGDNPGEMGASLPTVRIGGAAVEISCGGDSSCAILNDGSVKCWGDGAYGKLGQGNSQSLGDEAGEMGGIEAINLGTGVLAASPVVVVPTPAPTLAPTTIRFIPSPTRGPTYSATGRTPAAPAIAGNTEGDDHGPSSSGESKATNLTLIATSIVVPVAIAVLIFAGFVLYKNRRRNEENVTAAESKI